MGRYRPVPRDQLAAAILSCPLIHDLADDIAGHERRRRRHPLALHLAFGALARLWGSANGLDAAVLTGTWQTVLEHFNAAAAARGSRTVAPYLPPLTSDTYRHARKLLTSDGVLEDLLDAFTARSVELAHGLGLLLPDGPGSRTWPHPTRTIYGDGTIVKPLYRHDTERLGDPDAAEHHRYDGPQWGNSLLTMSVRGPTAHQRVVLAVGRVTQPGREAEGAVDLIRAVHEHARDGIQAVVYDGAFRGPHHETVMTELGLIAVTKVHPATRDGDDRTWRTIPLGHWVHQPEVGGECRHLLAIHNGSVHESVLDDRGEPALSPPCRRVQIRRHPRGRRGGFRFSLGVEVPCPRGMFTAWISPHPQPGDDTHRRPDQLRLIAPSDHHFQVLYGLRNDSEAINAEYKRTLAFGRASGLGWRRQTLDLMSWAVLNNSRAWWSHLGARRR